MRERYKLDGNIITESPEGWAKRTSRVEHERVLKGRLITEDGTLLWYKDGYRYIKSVFNANVCGEIKIEIERDVMHNGNWQTSFIGTLKMPECEFGIAPFYVKTPVVDNGYYARIKNNKSIKTTVNNARSKNDVAIALPIATDINMFTPSDGSHTGVSDRRCYPIYELFRYMIAFVTDDEIGFMSETFDPRNDPARPGYDPGNPAEYGNFVVMLGIDIRLPQSLQTDKFMELSFDELYSEVDKKFNIGFRMEYVDGKPTMRIEKASWFYREKKPTYLNYLRNIKRTVDVQNLISAIGLGSDITDDTTSLAFPENTRYFGFKDEQFYLFGQTNLDRVRDLKSQWIISSNIIEDIFVTGNDAHDDEICMVEITSYVPSRLAHRTNWIIAAPPYYYNEHLQNQHVINRWLDGIPQTVVAQLGIGNHRFKATRTTTSAVEHYLSPNPGGTMFNNTTNPYLFDDDFTPATNFDPSNSYGNGTTQGTPVVIANSRYTAAAAGIFTFKADYPLRVFHADSIFTFYREVRLKRYDSSNVLISTILAGQSLAHPAPGDYVVSVNGSFNMNATDYVVVETLFRLFTSVYVPGAYVEFQRHVAGASFECTFASIDEGGVYTIVDVSNQRFMKYNSNAIEMTEEKYDEIIADTTEPVYMNHDGQNHFRGWLEQLKFDRGKGKADITTLGRRIDEPNI